MSATPSGFSNFLKNLGPGLLYAGAAIGVSHLVQSTQAGANFGYQLVWVVILANVLKYPFFEFGPRYATARGESLVEGYQRIGGWAVALFILFTISTMWVIQAAVTVVTAGLAQYLTGTNLPIWAMSGILLGVCLGILGIGKYSLLDKVIKVVIVLLSLTTLIAVIAAAFTHFPRDPAQMATFSWGNSSHIVDYFIPLVGWMPAPIDIAIWHSVWSLAKSQESGRKITLRESLLDFKVGYWGTTILAVFFVALGALVIYGSGVKLEMQAGAFAKQLIEMYSQALGPAFKPIIGIAAFTTMFSTTLTCFDAFPRILGRSSKLLLPSLGQPKYEKALYWGWILLVGVGAIIILAFFSKSMGQMVKFATTLSFLTAPFLATLNYIAVTNKHFPTEFKPGLTLRVLSFAGLVFLYGFSGYYVVKMWM